MTKTKWYSEFWWGFTEVFRGIYYNLSEFYIEWNIIGHGVALLLILLALVGTGVGLLFLFTG